MYCHGTVEKQIQLWLINDLVRTWNLCRMQKKKMYKTRLNLNLTPRLQLDYAYSKSKNVTILYLSSDHRKQQPLVTFLFNVLTNHTHTTACWPRELFPSVATKSMVLLCLWFTHNTQRGVLFVLALTFDAFLPASFLFSKIQELQDSLNVARCQDIFSYQQRSDLIYRSEQKNNVVLFVSWPSWILSLSFFYLLLGGSVWDDAIVADAQWSHHRSCMHKKAAIRELCKQAWLVTFYATKIDTQKVNRCNFGKLHSRLQNFLKSHQFARLFHQRQNLNSLEKHPSSLLPRGTTWVSPWDLAWRQVHF